MEQDQTVKDQILEEEKEGVRMISELRLYGSNYMAKDKDCDGGCGGNRQDPNYTCPRDKYKDGNCDKDQCDKDTTQQQPSKLEIITIA